MDLDKDVVVPIILGCPFLATVGALVDVKKDLLTFIVGGEKVKFNFNDNTNSNMFDLDCKALIEEEVSPSQAESSYSYLPP